MNETPMQERFEQAIIAGDLPAMQSLLEDGSITLVPPDSRLTAIRLGIAKGSARTVQLLLQAGCSPNEWINTRESPAYWAAERGDLEILRELLKAGADAHGSPEKAAAADAAIRSGNLPILDVLIDSGIDPKRLDDKGHGLLHQAAIFNTESISRRLLELDVPHDVRDEEGLTPLHYAARYGAIQTLQLLVQHGADVHVRCNAGMTPALTGAYGGRFRVVAELVASGADPLARDFEGRSAFDLLCTARKQSDRECVWLLNQFPTLLSPGEELNKALVSAVRHGHIELVKKLADMGADFDQKPGGRTLLQCAPAKAEDLKRLLRALKSKNLIASAMNEPEAPSTPISSTPSPL